MNARAIPYSAVELAWISKNAQRPRREAHAEFISLFGRGDVSPDNFNSLCKRKGWMTGRTGRFAKGQASPNKGKVCPPGKGGRHPNAQKTQFTKGSRSGRAEALYRPVGTERVSREGYLERKIHDGMPLHSRWRGVHLIRWEERHGRVPQDHCLKCRDGNRQNTDPDNWACIPRAMLPYLNGWRGFDYEAAPAALRPTILTIAELRHRTREVRSSGKS